MDHHHARPPSTALMARRSLCLAGSAGLLTYALLREAAAAGAPADRRLSARRWIDRQQEMALALRAGSLAHIAWHAEVNRIAGEVDVAQLLAEIRRGRTTQAGAPFMRDPIKRNIQFIDDIGQPRSLSYAAAIFAFGPNNVITPHAHLHLGTAHMVIDGKIRIRTFDRIADAGPALIIRPTGDIIAGIGHAAAMTTERDNIHWFTPATENASTFDIIIDGLDHGQPDYLIQPVDPLGGQHRADGTIVAPLLSFKESMSRYSAAL